MKYIEGNLLESDEVVIAHGCNTEGVMGAGIAKQIAEKYPEALEVYLKDRREIGSYTSVYIPRNDVYVCNLITQTLQPNNRAKGIYIVASMLKLLNDTGHKKIGIPFIGCGLGGLDWHYTQKLLLEIEQLYDMEFTVYKYEPKEIK